VSIVSPLVNDVCQTAVPALIRTADPVEKGGEYGQQLAVMPARSNMRQNLTILSERRYERQLA
jgi:hypothetical protein